MKQLNLTKQDLDYLGRIAAAEASALGPEAMRAVIATVLNRVAQGGFGSDVRSVLEAKSQFEPVMKAGGKVENLPALEGPLAESVNAILAEIEAGEFTDPTRAQTGGSLYFLNEDLSNQRGTNFLSNLPRDGFVTYGKDAIQHTHAGAINGEAPVPDYTIVVSDGTAHSGGAKPVPRGTFLQTLGVPSPPIGAGLRTTGRFNLTDPATRAALARQVEQAREEAERLRQDKARARLAQLFSVGDAPSAGGASGFASGVLSGFSRMKAPASSA